MSPAFTPLTALLGGTLLGAAATLLWVVNGRTAGVSGIVAGALRPVKGEAGWQFSFLLGLLLVGAVAGIVAPEAIGASPLSSGGLVLAGLCVGVGTRLGSGCTSGHGVCGLSRGSLRSLVATVTFMATAAATVAVTHLLRSGQ